jgi:hypothetical protein
MGEETQLPMKATACLPTFLFHGDAINVSFSTWIRKHGTAKASPRMHLPEEVFSSGGGDSHVRG